MHHSKKSKQKNIYARILCGCGNSFRTYLRRSKYSDQIVCPHCQANLECQIKLSGKGG